MSTNAAEHINSTRRWLRYAGEDLATASHILRMAAPPRHACFLSQQSAEKAIKAVLVFLRIEFPPRHDLDFLVRMIPEDWQLRKEHTNLSSLTEWVVEGRYPGEWDEPTHEDAELAIEQARSVLESVTRDLRAHGYSEEVDEQH